MAQMEMSATRDESFKTPGPALSAAYWHTSAAERK